MLSYLEHRHTGVLAEDSMLSKLGNKLISQHLCLVQSSSDSVSYCADRRRVGSCPLCWNPWSPSLDPTCCPARVRKEHGSRRVTRLPSGIEIGVNDPMTLSGLRLWAMRFPLSQTSLLLRRIFHSLG